MNLMHRSDIPPFFTINLVVGGAHMGKTWFIIFVLILHGSCLFAREPYHATVTVDATSATVSAPNLVDLKRDLKSSSIQALIPFYTPTSPVSIDINLRGIDVLTSFPANSTTLLVEIPQTGSTQTFQGATREESLGLLKEFIRDEGPKHGLLKAYAKFSPIDPIAGNPNSLMSQMAQADYLLGRLSPFSGCDCCWRAQPIVHQFQVGVEGCRAFSDEFETSTVTIPARYSYSPDLDWALILDAPAVYFRNGGASSFFGTVGLGLRVPMTCNWSLTPIFRCGAGGTLDLCTSGSFVSFGVTSMYNLKLWDYVFAMTNYGAYFSSTNFWLTGVNFNYHQQSYVIKNGLAITSCDWYTVCGRNINFSLSFIDSYFTSGGLFIRHYDEVGAALLITQVNPCLDYDCLSLGFAYQYGQKKYKGYCLNIIYQF